MKVHAFDSADWAVVEDQGFSEQEAIATIEDALRDAASLLPVISKNVNVIVRSNSVNTIPEYGIGARTHDSEFIEIWFDRSLPCGAAETLRSIRQSVFHECNHAARWNVVKEDYRLVESAIFEGLATVFEREHAGYEPLYGKYEDDTAMQV